MQLIHRLVPLLVLPLACAANPAAVIPTGNKPGWVMLQEDARFLKVKYVVGVGMMEISSNADFVQQLDAAARRELAKTLKVEVTSQVQSYQASVTTNGASSSTQAVEASASEAVDLELQGVSIVDRWRDDQAHVAYAVAALDREATAAKLKAQIQTAIQSADDYASKGDAALATDPGAALKSFLRARGEADGAVAKSILLGALTSAKSDPPKIAVYDQKLTSVLNAIAVSAVEGDGVRATANQPLARPLVLKAEYKGAGAPAPLPGLTFAFSLPAGGQIEAQGTTGPDGTAKATVTNAGPMSGSEAKAVAVVDWAALAGGAGVSSAKQPSWIKALHLPEVSFRIVAKGLATTRVIVKVLESVEEGGPVKESAVEGAITAELSKAGFLVQDPKALVDACGGPDKLANIGDAELKAKARGMADIIILGTATSRFNKKFAGKFVYHKARGVIRAVDMNDGKVLANQDLDLPCDRYGDGADKAGSVALKALGDKVSPKITSGLKVALGY